MEGKEPLLLEKEVYCECGEKVVVVRTPFIANTIAITGICPKCKKLYTGDGEPDFESGTKNPAYYRKDYGITIRGMDYAK